jgi:putative oxidoreductase
MKHITIPGKIIRPILMSLDSLRAAGDLIVRLWVARIFWLSAMSKITAWTTTIVIFKYSYSVPFMSATMAAYLGTACEFILPVLLVLGLGGRLAIFVFFVYNLICVVSFHFLWTPPGASGLADHTNWGLLLMLLMLHGPGKYSLDYFIHRRWGHIFKLGRKDQYSWDQKPL